MTHRTRLDGEHGSGNTVPMKIEVQGVNQALNGMLAQVRRINKATARGITMTARDARDTLRLEMVRVFRQPLKPYILNAFGFVPADATSRPMAAEIYLKRDPQYTRHPLVVQIEGGVRATKRFERALQNLAVMPRGWFAVPTAAAAPNGRMRAGLVQQVMAGAAASQRARKGGSGAFGPERKGAGAREARRAREASGRAGGTFVFSMPRKGPLAPGIYLNNGVYLTKLFTYTPRVRYAQRLDFFGTVRRITAQRLLRNIELSFFT